MKTPASSAAPLATAIVPALVETNFCANSTIVPPLFGHHDDAVAEGVEVAEGWPSASAVESVDVLDEMPDDVAGIVVRDRVVAVSLAGIREAAALAGPPG